MDTQERENQAAHNRYLERVGRLVVEIAKLKEDAVTHEIEILETVYAKFSKDTSSGLMFDHFELLRHIEQLKNEQR